MTIFMELRCEKRGEGRNENNNRRWHGRGGVMQKFKCRRCRKIHAKDELVGKRNKSGWTDNCCPNCGSKTFTLVEGNADAE